MLQRQTQTAAFWRDHFSVASEDLEFLHNLLLDVQKPQKLSDMAVSLVEDYLRRESNRIESELSKGTVYVPSEQHEIGQTIVFPALEFLVGEVTDVRTGQNPEYGEFDVIKVAMLGTDETREFASNLVAPHRLSQVNGDSVLDDETLLSADELYQLYQTEIDESILSGIQEHDADKRFVQVDRVWLLADMLAEVHVGHLNIAEALIDIQSEPLETTQLLAEVELDKNVPQPLQIISLDHALNTDERFDQVSVGQRRAWYLKRLEPEVVAAIPSLLQNTPLRYNRALLSVELLQLEWELDDEWGESSLTSEVPSIVPSTSLTLTYPHRRYGTLPLSGRTRGFFPEDGLDRAKITVVDGRWGTRYDCWIVRDGRYIAGLDKWMEEHSIPVGAIVTVERAPQMGEIIVDFRTRRAKREWAYMASADLNANRLLFTMNKVQVACEYDEQMIFATEDQDALDRLTLQFEYTGVDINHIVEQVVQELAKLSSSGTVHAKSIYSAVNVVRRCAPGPIFYALISNRKFRDMGSGLFGLV